MFQAINRYFSNENKLPHICKDSVISDKKAVKKKSNEAVLLSFSSNRAILLNYKQKHQFRLKCQA